MDPDGREDDVAYNFWRFLKENTSGIDKLFSSFMQLFASDRSGFALNSSDVIDSLSKVSYNICDPNTPVFKTANSQNLGRSFVISSNFLKNLSTAMPAQADATLEDTVDIKGGYSAAVLGTSVYSKLLRDIGDISFNYTLVDGKVSDWNLTEKTTDGRNTFNRVLSKDEAIKFLNYNKDKIYENKNFIFVMEHLD